MSDLDEICEISLRLLMEYECIMHDHAKLSQYEILGLFVTKYISG